MNTESNRHKLHIRGDMSTRGADRAGQRLATAVLIFACTMGLATIIWAVRWW